MIEVKGRKTDEELIALARTDDKSATEELIVRYAELVRKCARQFFLIGGETEDLIQEGMVGLYLAIGDYKFQAEGGMSFKNFAYLCVRRRIIDAVKSAASKKNQPLNNSVSEIPENFAIEDNPEDALILHDEMREFKQKMSRVLSDFEFKIMTMYMDGMTCAEICDTTGKTFKSVDNALQRGKKKLQKLIEK